MDEVIKIGTMTAERFAQKVEAEGSLSYALIEYGLGSKDLDPTDPESVELHRLLSEFETSGGLDILRKINDAVDDLSDDWA